MLIRPCRGRDNAAYSQQEFLGIPYAQQPVGDLRLRPAKALYASPLPCLMFYTLLTPLSIEQVASEISMRPRTALPAGLASALRSMTTAG